MSNGITGTGDNLRVVYRIVLVCAPFTPGHISQQLLNDCRTHYFQHPHREDPEEGKRLENPGRSSINTSDDDGQRGHEEKGREYDVRGQGV